MVTLTYHAKLTGNTRKLDILDKQIKASQVVARYYLSWIRKHKEYRKLEVHKGTYFKIREHFPYLYSKLIQHLRDKVLSSVKAKKLFKIKNFKIPLIFDYQNFNLQFRDGYYLLFVRFLNTSFPIEGLRTIEKIKNREIKEIQIKKLDTGDYRIYFICRVPEQEKRFGDRLGLDVNLKNITLSDGKTYNLSPFIHRKREYRKHKQEEKVVNFTRNYIHQLSSELVKDLVRTGGSEVVLEDLTGIRRSSSKKNGTSKGKDLNYLLNNSLPFAMFQNFLTYKSKLNGIGIVKIDPRDTSKTCSECGSLDTERPRQSLFICHNCGLRMNADFNGAKNILGFSTRNGVLIDLSTFSSDINKEGNLCLQA